MVAGLAGLESRTDSRIGMLSALGRAVALGGKTARIVSAVVIANAIARLRPPRVARGSAFHAAIAAPWNQTVQASALGARRVIGPIRHSVAAASGLNAAIVVRFEWARYVRIS